MDCKTKAELYQLAVKKNIKGRSHMKKVELLKALKQYDKAKVRRVRMKGGGAMQMPKVDFDSIRDLLLSNPKAYTNALNSLQTVNGVTAQACILNIMQIYSFMRMINDEQANKPPVYIAYINTVNKEFWVAIENLKVENKIQEFVNQNMSKLPKFNSFFNPIKTRVIKTTIRQEKHLQDDDDQDPDVKFTTKGPTSKTLTDIKNMTLSKPDTLEKLFVWAYFYDAINTVRELHPILFI